MLAIISVRRSTAHLAVVVLALALCVGVVHAAMPTQQEPQSYNSGEVSSVQESGSRGVVQFEWGGKT
ncbi:MAG: hypothetical protein M3328_07080, partial [Chloroflexota bacterium]|nr:hypothetical protein [Chloroflexota bacterium]